MEPLPDFVKLSPEEAEREVARQTKLRQDFNSRARQSGPEIEAARALIIEDSLRQSYETQTDPVEKDRIANQLAENLSLQGRFIEASMLATDPIAVTFYKQAAQAIFAPESCDCVPETHGIDGKLIQLPKQTAVKEIYSIVDHRFVFLLKCGTCGTFSTSGNNPTPVTPKPVSDLELLRA